MSDPTFIRNFKKKEANQIYKLRKSNTCNIFSQILITNLKPNPQSLSPESRHNTKTPN